MNKKGMGKRALLTIFLITVVSSCSQTSISDEREAVSDVVERDIAWEYLRIQKLLPGHIVLPAIEPYLPAHFVALRHPKDRSKIYWGDKGVLEAYFEKGVSHLKSAVIRVNISLNVDQIDENSFSDEGSDSASPGVKNYVINKWKWGFHPVMSLDATIDDDEVHAAWIGLNYGAQVLYMGLIYPANQHTPSAKDLNMWSEFLKKTKPLEGHELYKAHGQDLREGFTLINVYDSVLRVSAEKRTGDGKIQVVIKPEDDQISCECLDVVQMLMESSWHFSEPILTIKSRIQVSGDANIIPIITVLLKEVSEFSNNEGGRYSNTLSRSEYGNVSIFNFCKQELLMQKGVLQK